MTVQVSQIHPPDSGLLRESSVQNPSDNSFQNYLEEEQKRLALILSPFGQFNFGSWFTYPTPGSNSDSTANALNLFSDIELFPKENYAANTQNPELNTQNQSAPANPPLAQAPEYYAATPIQTLLQDLLAKSGWLAPNLEAFPLLYQAQLEGKLLNKLDLQFLIDQILTQIKIVKEKGRVELTLGLKPENLGEILLTMTSRSGMISIQIQAPEETRRLIEAELSELIFALKKAGIDLEEVKVLATKEVDKHA